MYVISFYYVFSLYTRYNFQTNLVILERIRCLERLLDTFAFVRGVHRNLQYRFWSNSMDDGWRTVHKQCEECGKLYYCYVQLDIGLYSDEVLPGHGRSHGYFLLVRYLWIDNPNGNRVRFHISIGNEGQER